MDESLRQETENLVRAWMRHDEPFLRDYLVADTAGEQVAAVCDLLRAPERALELGRRARAFVEQNYDWETCLRPLDALLERLGKR